MDCLVSPTPPGLGLEPFEQPSEKTFIHFIFNEMILPQTSLGKWLTLAPPQINSHNLVNQILKEAFHFEELYPFSFNLNSLNVQF